MITIRYLHIIIALLFTFHLSAGHSFGAYGDYSAPLPPWLSQTESSANGNYVVNYVNSEHHSRPFVGDPDNDTDGLPDSWENNFLGNTTSNNNDDNDGDGDTNLVEFNDGSWPNEDYFRSLDTIDPTLNGSGQNLIVQDVIDTLTFCEDQYDAWGFNAPWGLPLNVYVRHTDYGGWGNVNPLWVSPDNVDDLNDPDRKGVAIHELFHNVQRSYPDTPNDSKWFIEGSARMSQDFFYANMDSDPASNYAGQIAGFLAAHNSSGLFERSYSAVFFWKYLAEQTGGTIVGQPSANFDAMHQYMQSSNGLEAVESLDQYLKDIPSDNFWYRKNGEQFFATWTTALYTRQFSSGSLSSLYYYQDEQENLPLSLQRPIDIENCLYTEVTNDYTPETVPLNGNVLYSDINPDTWTQSLDSWRSEYYAFDPVDTAKVVLAWIDGKTGQRNYYAMVTSDSGDVTDISYSYGEDFRKAYFNKNIDELGVVVTALGSSADYDLMVWTLSHFWIDITYPTFVEKQNVRLPESGGISTFEVHLKVWTEKGENPDDDIYIDGLSPDLFEVYVDGQAAQVQSGYQVLDEYWLTCVAPELDPGEYDLEVHLLDQKDEEEKSLLYLELPHVDRMIVIDRSGSMGSGVMGDNEKMLAAKSGGRLHTDLLVDDDMLGLVSFGGGSDNDPDNATLHVDLADVTANHKTNVKDMIDNDITDDPEAHEHTAMGQGIIAAYDQLINKGKPDDSWRITLLTDGNEDRAPYWADASVRGVVVPSEVMVDTIALGSGSHENLLHTIATDTLGDYFHVSVPPLPANLNASAAQSAFVSASAGPGVDPIVENKVADIYRMISERDLGHSRIWSAEGYAKTSLLSKDFFVYEGMNDLLFTINWPFKQELSYKVFSPGGHPVRPSHTSATHAVFQLEANPGTWRVELSSDSGEIPFLAVLSGYGDIKSKLFFKHPDNSRKIGSVQKICLSLLSRTNQFVDTEVKAFVTAPDNSTMQLALFDSGDHGDFTAGDNIYCRDYRYTPHIGTYDVFAIATGNDTKYEFRIEDKAFLVIQGDYDRDKDGMPDEWEQRYQLQGSEDDSTGDPDDDLVTNLEEFQNGGHPRNPDTDNGGTLDGSELKFAMNLTDYSDDRIGPPPSLIINMQPTDAVDPQYRAPRSRSNLVYWAVGAAYSSIDIYRGPVENGPFTLLEGDYPADKGPFEDGGLSNGVKYFYKVAAKTKNGIASRLSHAAMGIPKSDNLAPFGSVKITGPGYTVDLGVSLQLTSSVDTVAMRFSNSADFSSSSWEVFQPTRSNWKISGRSGVNFVFVQFRDGSGNISLAFQDGIILHEDLDGDNLGDEWERDYWGNLNQGPLNDWPDEDLLRNFDEYRNGTSPHTKDSDGDIMSDLWEVVNGTKPTIPDSGGDPDKDDYTNIEEMHGGTDPLDPGSHPVTTPGDVNGDTKLGLDDVILALKAVLGQETVGVNRHADVDGDKIIGLAEAIYVLRTL